MPVDFTLTKISELPVAGGVADSDEIVINQSGVTTRIRKDVFQAALVVTANAGVSISTVEVSGSDEITAQAGALLIAVVVVGSPGAVKVGTTDGGGEIIDDEITETNIAYSTQTYFETDTTLWLTGTATFKLYFLA